MVMFVAWLEDLSVSIDLAQFQLNECVARRFHCDRSCIKHMTVLVKQIFYSTERTIFEGSRQGCVASKAMPLLI